LHGKSSRGEQREFASGKGGRELGKKTVCEEGWIVHLRVLGGGEERRERDRASFFAFLVQRCVLCIKERILRKGERGPSCLAHFHHFKSHTGGGKKGGGEEKKERRQKESAGSMFLKDLGCSLVVFGIAAGKEKMGINRQPKASICKFENTKREKNLQSCIKKARKKSISICWTPEGYAGRGKGGTNPKRNEIFWKCGGEKGGGDYGPIRQRKKGCGERLADTEWMKKKEGKEGGRK